VDLVPGSGLEFAAQGSLRVPSTGQDLPVLAVAGA
jgi:hypothetical protein